MLHENCFFHFKNPDAKDSFIPEEDLKLIIESIFLEKIKTKSTTLEIDQDLFHEFKLILDNTTIQVDNIILDIFNEFNPSKLDSIFNSLYTVLSDKKDNLPQTIIIICSAIKIEELQSISQFLLKLCAEKKIGLIVINNDSDNKILEKGNLSSAIKIPKINSLISDDRHQIFDPEIIKNNLEKNTIFLYGHFNINLKTINFHSNGVLSIKRSMETDNFIPSFKSYIQSLFKSGLIKIMPLAIEESGIHELAKVLVDNEDDVINMDLDIINPSESNLIILVDFLCNAYDFNSLIKKLNKKFIFGDIKIVAISKFKNYTPAKSLKYKYFVECDFSEFGVTKNKCTYCFYDSVPISGNSFSHFTHSSSIFDSYSFWEFIKLTDSSYTLEHYKSKRTRNHFDFRIVCDKIFEKYSYTLAVRLVNLANENNIKPSWINKILFTNDSELKPLINELSSLLKISEENKIEIARESIYTVSADNPGEAIQDLFMRHKDNFKDDKQKIEDWNKSNNVIIVDQAVHNFRTLSALTSVCSHYKFTVLLISLFINRTDSISSANFKKNKFHLLSLYDWPVKSTRFDLCFCRN